jgi:hypothetical protein
VVLDSGEVVGEFSDNVLTLDPCGPAASQYICFSTADVVQAEEQGSGTYVLDLQVFMGNVTAVALNSNNSFWWQS